MKRQLLFSSLLLFPLAFLQAKTVEVNKALEVAEAAMGESTSKKRRMSVSALPENRVTLVKSASAESNYYIFNNSDNSGFVIIAGDDAAKPVLGYSDKGSYDGENLPPSFEYWLNFLNRQITHAVENNLPADPQWDNFSASDVKILKASVVPLLSTRWDQGAPYNNQCPLITNGHAVTGCVATAMAQIMNYHKYPLYGRGSIDAYTTRTEGVYIPAINLSNVLYDWDNMLDYYTALTNRQEEQNAVSQLMYHCGTSIQMDYDLHGSGAYSIDVEYALVNYFGYDASIYYEERDYFTDEEWENILKQQIRGGLPVLYSGVDTNAGGHAFVCDGYNEDGLFHFNWGWSGAYNGYFETSALNPPAGYEFNYEQNIIINIKPNQNGESICDMVMWPDTDMSSETTQITSNTEFSVTTSCLNLSYVPFVGYIGIALFDDDDNMLTVLGRHPQLIRLPLEYGGMAIDISVEVPETIPDGRYAMRSVAIMADTVVMRSTTDHTGKLQLIVCNTGDCRQYYAPMQETTIPEIEVYPNPVEDVVHISGEKVLSVRIEDLSGNMVKQSNDAEIPVGELQSGMYLFVIETENGFVTKKILKR